MSRVISRVRYQGKQGMSLEETKNWHRTGQCGDVCGDCEFHPAEICGEDCGGCCNEAEFAS